jgi:c-di-GMP-binding flagellar brake protein YcgR
MSLDRRFDSRIPLEIYVNAFVGDRPHRAVTANISETGLYLNTLPQDPLPPGTGVGLEFTLPGLGDSIWAAGELCYDTLDDYFYGTGVRFTAMAGLHARLVREYCFRRRARFRLREAPRGS